MYRSRANALDLFQETLLFTAVTMQCRLSTFIVHLSSVSARINAESSLVIACTLLPPVGAELHSNVVLNNDRSFTLEYTVKFSLWNACLLPCVG